MKKTSIFQRENSALYLTLVIVFLLMWFLNGGKFLSWINIRTMANQLPLIGFLSIGMMFAMLTGGINLSIIANANMNGVVIWLVLEGIMGKGNMVNAGPAVIALAILCGFLASLLIGLVNGFLIAMLDIPALLVTLGTMTLVSGLNIVITKGYTISGFPAAINFIGTGSLFGIPVPILLFAIMVAITSVILTRTRFGFSLYMMGANPVAAEYSSVDIPKITIVQYMCSACFASLTSLIMIGQYNSVKSNHAESYLLVAVLASFFGGVDPNGGFGKISGVVAATIILQIISSGLNLLRMDPFMTTAMWGGIVILVILARALGRIVRKRFGGGAPA